MAVIRNATPLTLLATRAPDPIMSCNICGHEAAELGAWREHDARDKPLIGTESLVFIGNDHPACIKAMEAHPRLYAEEMGWPGHLPRLCGPCTFRQGMACSHPDLRSNGGKGLLITMHDPLRAAGVIICGRNRPRYVRHALECPGRKLADDTYDIAAKVAEENGMRFVPPESAAPPAGHPFVCEGWTEWGPEAPCEDDHICTDCGRPRSAHGAG